MKKASLSLVAARQPGQNASKVSTPPSALLHGVASSLLTLLLLGFCTWGQLALQEITHDPRPYTIFYLIPVAIGAALLGSRGGLLAAVLAVVLARLYLFTDNKHGMALFSFPNVGETIEFIALLSGTATIALVTGHLRTTLGQLYSANLDLKQVNLRLTESEQERRTFNRDVLLAVTGGKLRLVEPDELSNEELAEGSPRWTQFLRVPQDATTLRKALVHLATELGMGTDRISDLSTAATEAATNAIKHGNGGAATVWANDEGVTVQVQDHGTGIAPAHLARATLEQGFSTRVSLGMGFHLMLQTTDQLALCTQTDGTTIFLSVSTHPRPSAQDSLLARYSNVA